MNGTEKPPAPTVESQRQRPVTQKGIRGIMARVQTISQPVVMRHQTISEQITARLDSQFAKRAVALAIAAHLDYTPRLLEMRQRSMLFVVPSRDWSCEYHVVADKHVATVRCECMAGSQSKPCCHTGAVLHYIGGMVRDCAEYLAYADN